MIKTTVYLPEELETRLDAESAATGVSKAELIRQGIALLLDNSSRPKQSRPLPVFRSGRLITSEDMDEAIYEHIKERTNRR
ncbi:ribbon-helix-helix domain-containing protein [Streptomyces sp. A3M-1-3]|uniref:ribbon-helix-helix domain-containing protein n=1 Tax=Streptomyces sp. A3M-1-3 TaxID=2962044 RepID=UPI0020B80D04|nr:ribbon-helix-helix domain-containing protein [Streptomyces sp. A3M-1-3]MCP3818986.1 ribbon-helix-helix domain-containing protein [Streptomyces sp. A3M-1-3]